MYHEVKNFLFVCSIWMTTGFLLSDTKRKARKDNPKWMFETKSHEDRNITTSSQSKQEESIERTEPRQRCARIHTLPNLHTTDLYTIEFIVNGLAT